jgi:hypothetical protein
LTIFLGFPVFSSISSGVSSISTFFPSFVIIYFVTFGLW